MKQLEKITKVYILLGILFIITAAISYFWFSSSKLPINVFIPVKGSQNAFSYLPKDKDVHQRLISAEQQQADKQAFLKHHYAVWDKNNSATQFCITADNKNCFSILTYQQDIIEKLQKNPSYGDDYHKHPAVWLNKIINNMDLKSFPNQQKTNQAKSIRGIMVNNAALRSIPTLDPSFSNISQPGEGYPFDNLQESAIWLGTPIHIIHQSRDKQWLLVKGPGLVGWVKANSVAKVDDTFIAKWKKYPLGTFSVRHTEINNDSDTQPINAYLGSLLPIVNIEHDSHQHAEYEVLIPYKSTQENSTNEFASLKIMPVSSDVFHTWPLKPTPYNFAKIINTIVGMPYGWGDIGFNTDCSGTLRSLFSAFAIWLPRNSYSQAHYGGTIYPLPITQYPVAKRKEIFKEGNSTNSIPKPIPFLTVISFGGKEKTVGHVALYMGQDAHNGRDQFIVFQSAWGMHLVKNKNTNAGRAIIGRAVLSPLELGNEITFANAKIHARDLWHTPGFNLTFLK